MNTLSEEYIESLKKLAGTKTKPEHSKESNEDFIPYDWFGGNMDDAYYGGSDDGEIMQAREILDVLGVDYS